MWPLARRRRNLCKSGYLTGAVTFFCLCFWFIGFVLSIASAAWGFLYLKTMNSWLQKKKKKKKKRKNDQAIGYEPSLLHLRRLKSQHLRKSSSLSPTHLSSPIMATAKGLTLSHLPSSPEARMPPLLGVPVPVHRWHPLIEFGSPPYPTLALNLG